MFSVSKVGLCDQQGFFLPGSLDSETGLRAGHEKPLNLSRPGRPEAALPLPYSG